MIGAFERKLKMAYMEHGKWEIFDVLKQLQRGEKIRYRARSTKRSCWCRSVRHYLRLAKELGWVPGEADPGEAFTTQVSIRIKPGPLELDRELDMIHKPLILSSGSRPRYSSDATRRRGLTLTKVHTLLMRQGEIRPAVIIRKHSLGNRSEKGLNCQAVLMSINRTLKRGKPESDRYRGQCTQRLCKNGYLSSSAYFTSLKHNQSIKNPYNSLSHRSPCFDKLSALANSAYYYEAKSRSIFQF